MQFRKLRGRGGGSDEPDDEGVTNIPMNWLEIEGLVDGGGQVVGKEVAMQYDPATRKIEIYLEPEDIVGDSGTRRAIVADGSGSDD